MLAIRQIIGCSITDASDSGARAEAVALALDNCSDGRENDSSRSSFRSMSNTTQTRERRQ